jgi:hypothetical protein
MKRRIIKFFLPHDYYSEGLRQSCWRLFLFHCFSFLLGSFFYFLGYWFCGIILITVVVTCLVSMKLS